MVETISRPQLTQAVIREVGLSRKESAEMVESVLAEVSEALVRGETVRLSRSSVMKRNAIMRNLRTPIIRASISPTRKATAAPTSQM